MANENKDVLRVCAAASTLATTIREKQIGFETDTYKLVFKAPGGSHYDYPPMGEPGYYSYFSVDEYIYRYGDSDTYYRLRPDRLSGVAGGITFYDFIEDTQDVIEFNPDQGDVDFIVNASGVEALNIAGDTGQLKLAAVSGAATCIFGGTVDIWNVANIQYQFGGSALHVRSGILCFSDTDSDYGELVLLKSHSDTFGTPVATIDGEWLGGITFRGIGSGNAAWADGAYIYAKQNGAAGALHLPTDLYFFTATTAGANQVLKLGTDGIITFGNADTADANTLMRIWKGTAGTVDSAAGSIVTLENNDTAYLSILTPNNKIGGIIFGDPDDNDVGKLAYNHSTNSFGIVTAGAERLAITASEITQACNVTRPTINSINGTVTDDVVAIPVNAISMLYVTVYFTGAASGYKTYIYLVSADGSLNEVKYATNAAGDHTNSFTITGGNLRWTWTCDATGHSAIIKAWVQKLEY